MTPNGTVSAKTREQDARIASVIHLGHTLETAAAMERLARLSRGAAKVQAILNDDGELMTLMDALDAMLSGGDDA